MRARVAVALGLLTATTVHAQSGPFRPVPVRSCPYADSLLGPLGGDARVTMYGFYDKDRDTSYFVAGSIGDPKTPIVRYSTKFAGTEPVRDPAIQAAAFPFGRDAQDLAELSRHGLARSVFILNDSVTLYPRSTVPGRFESGATTMTPSASMLLEGEDLFKVVAAPKAFVRFGPLNFTLTDVWRREIRALIRVAVCPR